jgi:hypothetical protein
VKIKGRFIAVLAAVGLLAALLPLAPAGAVAGTVSLGGGDKGLFFSDQTEFNIVNIGVEDSDLSPVREGKARFTDGGGALTFTLSDSIIGGEEQQVDKFAGTDGTDNGNNTWTFELSERARDADNDGDIQEDDITLVVNGAERTTANFTVTNTTDAIGAGISHVTVDVAPNDAEDSVVITYEITEYEFTSATPIRLFGTEVHYGSSFADATNQKNVDTVGANMVEATSVVGSATNEVVVTFIYNVTDSKKNYVTVTTNTSLSTNVDRKLTGTESSAASSLFQSSIAILASLDYSQVVSQEANLANDDTANGGNGDGDVQISELNNASQLGDDLQERVEDAAVALGLSVDQAASKLEPLLIPAIHGDTLTVNYADTNPRTTFSRQASVDMEAPEVTLVGPAHKLFTSDNLLTLSAEVVDAGAGVSPEDINIVASSGITLGATPQRAPIVDGYRVSNVVTSSISEGAKQWAILVMDKVGNVPAKNDPDTKANEAALGAAAPDTAISSVGNAFKFAVDTSGPTLASGETGVYLKNAGVTSGDKQESEGTNNREWLRVSFNLGTGTAPLDSSTVSATDFTVDGATPLDVKVNAKTQGDDDEFVKGSAVYLQVGEMDTDARPTVKLVGQVRDMAGNPRTDGTVSNLLDGLAPVLTVTPSAEIANKSVTITVTSSERLGLNPSVGLTTAKPVKGTAPSIEQSLAVSLQTGALTTWTATYTNPSGDASIQYVVVSAADQASNSDKVGVAANDKDIVSFQVDDADPGLLFNDAEGNDLEDTKQQEGAVWIVAEFDDDEYTGDSYRKVTLDSVSLTDSSGNEITSDPADLFGGNDVACDGGKCATFTLAIDLTPGDYNIAASGTDAAGNSVSDDVDFKVIARKPFGLDLKPGVNLISIPGSPVGDSGNLNILFEDEPVDLVTTYDRSMDLAGENPWLRSTRDPETGLFTGDISTLQPGVAYFVTADARATVDITLQSVVGELPPTLMVRFGYNAVGFSSISPTATAQPIDDYLNSIPWTVAYSYDPTPGRGWEVLRPGSSEDDSEGAVVLMVEPGRGYLVFSRFDATLTP